MAIEHTQGGTSFTGEHVNLFRLTALKYALKLEIAGMKKRGKSAYATAKNELGFKGNRQNVLNQLIEYTKEQFPEETKNI